MKRWAAMIVALLCLIWAGGASADQTEIRVARGRPFGHLPMIVMQYYKLFEKHAAAEGIPDLKIDWQLHPTATVGSDAILSGSTDILSTGATTGILLWSKTKGTSLEVRQIAGESALPTVLVTRDPKIQSIRDLSSKDRIALVGVKISNNAILLEMAAAKEFGQANFAKLDPLTVTQSPPDSVAALLSSASTIDCDFNIPPYTEIELSKPGMHAILNSADIIGKTTTFSVPLATKRFADANPKLMRAFFDALTESEQIINTDQPRAIAAFLALGDKAPEDILRQALNDPKTQFSTTPSGMLAVAQWMQKTGQIKQAPDDWKGMFFPIAYGLNGS